MYLGGMSLDSFIQSKFKAKVVHRFSDDQTDHARWPVRTARAAQRVRAAGAQGAMD